MNKQAEKELTFLRWRLQELTEDLREIQEETDDVVSQISEIERQTSLRDEPEWE